MKKIAPLFLLFLISCTSKSEYGLDQIHLHVGGHEITVELARTPQQRETGLMFRKSLPDDRGMLFVFVRESHRSFWMKNTYIPLSIAYMDREGIILNIENMYPLDTRSVPSMGPAKYALEVNQGQFRKWGISVGDIIDLSDLYSETER